MANGYGGKPVPFYKNYYAGGIGTIRGYKDNSLGPKVSYPDANGNSLTENLGGTRRVTAGAEIFFPVPGMKEKDRSMRLSTFFDAGTLWDSSTTNFSASDIRYSVGLGMSWQSPIGPLKFSFGFPLVKKDGDEAQRFQFLIGTVM